jgi:hypothetical protein
MAARGRRTIFLSELDRVKIEEEGEVEPELLVDCEDISGEDGGRGRALLHELHLDEGMQHSLAGFVRQVGQSLEAIIGQLHGRGGGGVEGKEHHGLNRRKLDAISSGGEDRLHHSLPFTEDPLQLPPRVHPEIEIIEDLAHSEERDREKERGEKT